MNDSSPTSGTNPANHGPPERATLRASDADRDQTARRLRCAASEGRLLVDELEHRLDAAFCARTYGELALLVDDLPTQGRPKRRGPLTELIRLPSTAAIAFTVAAVVTLVLIAAMVGIEFGHSSAAAPHQLHPRIGLNPRESR